MHRRGVENARAVAAVMDGAEWLQTFTDYHCPHAVRILDFPHAAEHISPVGDFLHGEQTAEKKHGCASICINSSTKVLSSCSQSFRNSSAKTQPSNSSVTTLPTSKSVKHKCCIPPFKRKVGRLAAVLSRAEINWLLRRVSKVPECTGQNTTSTRSWPCVTSSVPIAGKKIGSRSKRTCAPERKKAPHQNNHGRFPTMRRYYSS